MLSTVRIYILPHRKESMISLCAASWIDNVLPTTCLLNCIALFITCNAVRQCLECVCVFMCVCVRVCVALSTSTEINSFCVLSEL